MKLPSIIEKISMRAEPRIVLAGLFCFFVVLSNVSWAPAKNAPASAEKPDSPEKQDLPEKPDSPAKPVTSQFIQREGTRIVDRGGYFRMDGDRVVFFSSERKNRYVALENLNLERIVQALADQPRQRLWKVTGMLTEYQGENYLLVEKALLENWDSKRRKPR